MTDLKLAEQQTREFMANEFKEYHELTGLTEFKHYPRDPHERDQHYLEVEGNVITLGHISENLVLYKGTIDGAEGSIDEGFMDRRIKQLKESWNLDPATVRLRAHGDLRRIAAKINFRAKAIWNERLVITCDHEAGLSTSPSTPDDENKKPVDELLTLCNPNNPYVKVKLNSIWAQVGDKQYQLTPTETSFIIHEIDGETGALTPVNRLILAYDHTLRAYLYTIFK